MAPFPQDVQQGLISEHERDEGERLQLSGAEPEPELSERKHGGGEGELARSEGDAQRW